MDINVLFNGVIAFWAVSAAIMISSVWIGLTYAEAPTWKERARFTIVLATILASIALVYFTKKFWGHPLAENPTTAYQLGMALYLAITYCLISSIPITLAAHKKNGFSKLKNFKEGGTIDSLIFGSVPGVITWLTFGLGNGLVIALSFWLIVGSLTGWKDEFEIHGITKIKKTLSTRGHFSEG